MDNLALTVTKAITDLLEQNEKRFVGQQAAHESQGKLLEGLQAKIDSLETKCQQLSMDNKNLRDELRKSKKRDEEIAKETAKETAQIKSDIEKMHGRLDEFNGWVKLITALAQEISELNNFRNETEDKMKGVLQNQSKLATHVTRLQQQTVANSLRPTVKSPSTSSFFSTGNTHSSLPRLKPSKYTKGSQFLESPDPDDDISEIEADAEKLKQGVEALNELQLSFERSSFYSDN